MKHTLLFFILALGLSACDQEIAFEPVEHTINSDLSEPHIEAFYVESVGHDGCNGENRNLVPIEDASVTVLLNTAGAEDNMWGDGITDANGRLVFQDVPIGDFHIEVRTELGRSSQRIVTKRGRAHTLYFRF